MKTYRRQRQRYLFATVLGVIAVVNLLFYLILYRPAQAEFFQLRQSILKDQSDVKLRRTKIERLEKLNAQLETSAQDRQRLITMHFIAKDTGWSQIVPRLDAMVQRAGVTNQRKDYSIVETPQFGLYSVKIRLPVIGLYPNLVSLIKEIENSETFFIIESIDVRGRETAGAQEVSMDLNLETFFYQ
jgi:hypothetical protein